MRNISPIDSSGMTAGQEGSETGVQILLLLHSRPHGMSRRAIAEVLGMPVDTVDLALEGLQRRYRAETIGHGMAARWYTWPHFCVASGNAITQRRQP